jgi:NAD(P)-dependent dehydrogenase (short-subunit alcohol dehydrogenase family)
VSGFGRTISRTRIGVDVKGKTVLVTGASSGIGLEACVQLARMGADVVMVARDERKGETALGDVTMRSQSSRVSLMTCDLASLRAVSALAGRVQATLPRLDVLVNNAGSVSPMRRTTPEGFEQTFAVNHLAGFLLTNLLLGLIQKSGAGRVVNVSSVGHRSGDIDFDNLQFERGGYSTMKAYGRSKLANILFTRELACRLAGTGTTANCLHPGAVATNIWNHASWYLRPLLATAKLFMLSAAQGAATIVYLAASPEVEGRTGGYYEKNKLVEPSPLARDEQLAARLWDVSRQLTSL